MYSWHGRLTTAGLVSELPNVAGGITSFTEPFVSQGLAFDSSRCTTFLDVFERVKSCPGITPNQALWRVPGFLQKIDWMLWPPFTPLHFSNV